MDRDRCFNTQPPEGGWVLIKLDQAEIIVSTHSRPKAAGKHGYCDGYQVQFQHTAARRRLATVSSGGGQITGFNTQPPEGGWY